MAIALIMLAVLVLGFLAMAGVFALGLYLGWFNIGSAGGKDHFEFTLDADRRQKAKRNP